MSAFNSPSEPVDENCLLHLCSKAQVLSQMTFQVVVTTLQYIYILPSSCLKMVPTHMWSISGWKMIVFHHRPAKYLFIDLFPQSISMCPLIHFKAPLYHCILLFFCSIFFLLFIKWWYPLEILSHLPCKHLCKENTLREHKWTAAWPVLLEEQEAPCASRHQHTALAFLVETYCEAYATHLWWQLAQVSQFSYSFLNNGKPNAGMVVHT